MSDPYIIDIHHRQQNRCYTFRCSADQYLLKAAEDQAIELPFACRNGACTTCAVRILKGSIFQPEAMGISKQLKSQGYALLCVGYPTSDLQLETQDEDEVYELQFGRFFGQGRTQRGLLLEED